MIGKIISAAIIIIIVSFLFSCKNPDLRTEVKAKSEKADDNPDILQKINNINAILGKAVRTYDYETIIKYHTDDAIISPGLGPSIQGKEAMRKSYTENKKMEVVYHSFETNNIALWESGDKVYERGTYGMSYSYKGHQKPDALYGSYFNVWQKENDGSLKIKYLIWNLGFDPCG